MKFRIALASLFVCAFLPVSAATVNIKVFNFDYGFNPPVHADPIIEVGDTVHWIWDASFHTVTSGTGQFEVFDSGLQNIGFTFDHTFTQVGDTGYYCGLHGLDQGGGQVSGMAGHFITANTCLPTSFSLLRGLLISGGLSELQSSDNTYLTVKRGFVVNASEPPIQVNFFMTSPVMNPTTLAISLEEGVNASGLSRRIEVKNVTTGLFEQIDSSAAQLADKISQFKLTGTLSRFIDQSNGKVNVKVIYFAAGPVSIFGFQARFDRVAVLAL